MINIPIYRAKKIDSDEWVEGYYVLSPFGNDVIHENIEYGAVQGEPLGGATSIVSRIDINTLAIHFPNMVDKNGKKIFASLSEDGDCGDIIQSNVNSHKYVVMFDCQVELFSLLNGYKIPGIKSYSGFEVVGQHKA